MNLGGGNVQPQRDVVEGAGADPADAALNRMEDRQKTMPPASAIVESNARVTDSPFDAWPVSVLPT